MNSTEMLSLRRLCWPARWLVPLLALLLLATPRTLSAHGAGLQADVRYQPAPPVAGEPLTFEVTLAYADDNDPLEGGEISISAQGPNDETLPATSLTQVETTNRWTGQVILPTEGIWTMQLRLDLPGGTAQDRYNVQVSPPGTAPSGETGHFILELDLQPIGGGQPFWQRSWPLFVAALIVVGVVLAFWFLPAAQPQEHEQQI